MTSWFRKTPKKKFLAFLDRLPYFPFYRTIVLCSKSLNISRSPNARTLILVSKHFYIWGIDTTKIFSELVRGFYSYPHFSLFWNFEKFQFFWDYLENPLRYVSVPRDKKVCTHDMNTFNVVFWPPVFNNGGVRENLSFSIMLNYLVTPSRYINTCRGKKLLLMTIKLLFDFVSTPW